MAFLSCSPLSLLSMLIPLLCLNAAVRTARPPNVLFLILDDMRASFDEPTLRLENFHRLAQSGILFRNAYAQQSLCAPSRNSMLTGRRPHSLHLFDFYSYWRESTGNFTTLPQFLKDNGYQTYSYGKIFHPGKSSNFTDDFPYSWTEPPYHPSTLKYKEAKVCTDKDTGKLSRNLVCPVNVATQPGKTLPDIQTTNEAVKKLKHLRENCNKCPYFMAVGFYKPHVPFKFPERYLDFYPLSSLTLPSMPDRPSKLPDVAWNPWTDVRSREDITKLNISFPFGRMPDDWSLKIKQSYYSALTYVDDLIGDILAYVDTTNTIIILTSDHGWSLGEHGEWAKYSNYDVSLKVPLIFYIPQIKRSNTPITTDTPVELVDLFPTIAELSGITEHFPTCPSAGNYCTEGRSLMPLINSLIDGTIYTEEHFAFSQYPRPGVHPTLKPNSDKPRLDQIKIMGYSVRSDRYRYTEWVAFNHTTFKPDWEDIYAEELYDHYADPDENSNLSDQSNLNNVVSFLSDKLRSTFY